MYSTARTAAALAPSGDLAAGILDWLVRADAGYRNARKLARAPKYRLDDMGIGRAEADATFVRRFAGRDLDRPTSFGW